MKRICLSFILFLSLFYLPVFAKNTDYTYLDLENVSLSDVKANHILLYNLNDEKVVYKLGNEDKVSIASLTKIMTALVAIEKNDDLDKLVSIPNGAFYNISGYAEAGFKVGEKVTIRDLLYGTLLPSGVEAAQALALVTSGSFTDFVSVMNEKAEKIGMKNTRYSNPVGRDDENNYSTLDNLKTLLLYALKNETFKEIYTSRTYTATNGLELKSTLVGPSNRYHLNISSIKGSKSGFTKNAGLCLSSLAEYNGISYLLIITNSLYANGFPNHIVDSLSIYDYFMKHYDYQNVLLKGQILERIPIKDARTEEYQVISNEDMSYYLDKNIEGKLNYQYSGVDFIDYKMKMNDKLGDINILYNDEILYTYPVYLTESISFKYTKFVYMGIGIFVLLLLSFLTFKLCRKKKRRVCHA